MVKCDSCDAAGAKRLGDADPGEHLQRVGMNDGGTRGVEPGLERVDHDMVDAGLLQRVGKRQPGRPRAHDQHLRFVRQHFDLLFANVRW